MPVSDSPQYQRSSPLHLTPVSCSFHRCTWELGQSQLFSVTRGIIIFFLTAFLYNLWKSFCAELAHPLQFLYFSATIFETMKTMLCSCLKRMWMSETIIHGYWKMTSQMQAQCCSAMWEGRGSQGPRCTGDLFLVSKIIISFNKTLASIFV